MLLPVESRGGWKAAARRVVADVEQDVRASPLLHSLFYAVITRSALARDVAGRVKSRVRQGAAPATPRWSSTLEDQAVRVRRDAAVGVRLGLRHTGGAP